MAKVVEPKKRTRKRIPHQRMSENVKYNVKVKSRKRTRPRGRRVIPASVGRPSLLNREYLDITERLAYLGETTKGYAKAFGVSEDTINLWLRTDEGFIKAIRKGGMIADGNVAKRLYERSIGYEHDDVHMSAYMGDVTATPIRKYYPPDTQAAAMWLRNRRPDLWRTDAQLATRVPDGEDENVVPTKIEISFKDARVRPREEPLTDSVTAADGET
jgi:hypothetical protein